MINSNLLLIINYIIKDQQIDKSKLINYFQQNNLMNFNYINLITLINDINLNFDTFFARYTYFSQLIQYYISLFSLSYTSNEQELMTAYLILKSYHNTFPEKELDEILDYYNNLQYGYEIEQKFILLEYYIALELLTIYNQYLNQFPELIFLIIEEIESYYIRLDKPFLY